MFHKLKTAKKKKHSWIATLILILFFLVGLSVMLYPTVSDYLNTKHQSYAIARYDETMNSMSQEDYSAMFQAAEDYNQRLKATGAPLNSYQDVPGYADALNIAGSGIMGYITIPQIQVQLPIYHGTSEEVLNVAVGHLEGTTLPIGGRSTHAILSAHRGLPSAKLFSDLDKLVVGDVFTVTILNQVLTYQVDKIEIVEPQAVNRLAIQEGEDYITLLTCTPYGVNTHRLLVRGRRIENAAPELNVRVSADAVQLEPGMIAAILGGALMLLLFVGSMLGSTLQQAHEKKTRAQKQRLETELKAGEKHDTNQTHPDSGDIYPAVQSGAPVCRDDRGACSSKGPTDH